MIEKTTTYATTVPDLNGAWEFVMAHIDAVGGDPQISINPIWQFPSLDELADIRFGEEHSRRVFEVSVSGMSEESR